MAGFQDEIARVEAAAREAAERAADEAFERMETLWSRTRQQEEAREARRRRAPLASEARTQPPSLTPRPRSPVEDLRTADYFAILGVPPDADDRAIEAAYGRQRRAVTDPEHLEHLAEAYDVLRHAGLRARYREGLSR